MAEAAAADPAEAPAVAPSAPEAGASPAEVKPAASADDGAPIAGMKPTKRKRAGTVTKGKDGKEPAKPAGDGRTAQPEFDPGHWVEKWNIWWLNDRGGGYFMPDPYKGEWMCLTESNLERWLQSFGLEKGDARARQPIREVERIILWVQAHRKLDAVLNIAGHRPGVVSIRTLKVLVRKGPNLMPLLAGDWSMLRKMLEGFFWLPLEGPEMPSAFKIYVKGKDRDHEKEQAVWRVLCREIEEPDTEAECENPVPKKRWVLDQTPVFYGWLKLALEVYHRRAAGEDVMRNGQGMVIAGKPDGGKSLLQQYIITPMLGGRMAKPDDFLTGSTNFNSELFASEHLAMGDSPLSTKMEDRLRFGEFIKMIVAEQWHRFHPKGKDAMIVNPVWRLSISINDDQDNIRSLPPVKEGVADKIHLLHVNAVEMPMRTTTLDEYRAFGRRIEEELPAFAHWLMNEWEMPEVLQGARFGMISIQAPDLMREMFEDSPSGEILELIDQARWEVAGERQNLWTYVRGRTEVAKFGDVDKMGCVWTGSSHELKALLTSDECSVSGDVRGMLKTMRIDRLLGRLKKEEPNRVEQHRTKTARLWRVARPPQ
jgi:hypothetical protein